MLQQKRFFSGSRGWTWNWKLIRTVKTSLQHLFEGTADFAAVISTPVVYQSFERDDFCLQAVWPDRVTLVTEERSP